MSESKKLLRLTSSHALRNVKIDDIGFDTSYQRDVVPKHKKIIADFNKDALGLPLIGQREDNSLWCVDGRQRITALKALGHTEVRCEVFVSKGPEHEAEVFKIVNRNRTPLKPLQIFNAALVACDEDAWAIKDAVEKYGFEVPRYSGATAHSKAPPEVLAKRIGAVAALQRIYLRAGVAGIEFVCSVLQKVWPDDPNKTKEHIVLGLYTFWQRYKREVDLDKLCKNLAATQPGRMIYSASLGSGDRVTAVADIIERQYRKRKVN